MLYVFVCLSLMFTDILLVVPFLVSMRGLGIWTDPAKEPPSFERC